MPTNTASVAGKSCTTVAAAPGATAASAAVSGAVVAPAGKGCAAPADFLAMLGQMLQGPATEAGELAVEALDLGGDTDPASDTEVTDELDPALLADQVLAMAAMCLPVVPPPPGATGGVTIAASADGAAAPATGQSSSILALVADALAAEATDAADGVTDRELLAKQRDAAAPGTTATAVTSAAPVTVAQAGQLNTQLVTQTTAPDFPAVAAEPAQVTQRVVHSSVGSNAWANELGTRLTLMAGQGQHSASLRLSPEHLGPLEVRIDMSDDKASVWFGAQHADTRAALNEALPRLRELFAASGMMLTDAGVSQQPPGQEARGNAERLAQALNRDAAQAPPGVTQSVTSVTGTSLLDLYA